MYYDFNDSLKSISRGYASFDYEMKNYIIGDLVEVSMLINSDIVDSFKSQGKLSELAKVVMNDERIIKYFKDFESILNK